ncbi:MFS transporter [Vibrio aphrogenes]|uniref:MFS transporter n=1 Tax=Vibrio aphrogenes TaxID=1891186 RepID=UPI000B35D9CB|nr:MFS transporter [Vibrio aphrogenes]
MKNLSALGRYTLLCIACLTIMVGAVVAPGLISLSEALGVTDNSVLLMTLPALGAVIFAPAAGKLIDKFGAYPSLIYGLFFYGLLGVTVYWLHGPVAVFINRILLGGITSVVMAGCTVLISQWYFGKARLGMIAKQGMAIELGGVIFLFIGGMLATQHWALPLSLYLIAWVFLIMLVLFVPRQHPAEPSTDNQSQHTETTQGLTLKGIYLVAVLSMVTFFTAIVSLPKTMHAQNYTEDQVGFLLAFISLVAVVAAHFMPKLTNAMSESKILIVAFLCYGVASLCFTQDGTLVLVMGAIFNGAGFGFSIPLLNHMTVERSAANVRGRNLSYFTMSVFSGQFLTSFIEYIPGEASHVFLSSLMVCVLVIVGLFLQPKEQKRNHDVHNL